MKDFKVISKYQASLATIARICEFLVGNDAKVVGSKCGSGLPSISPHSSTYSPLTLSAPIGQLMTAYTAATPAPAATTTTTTVGV